MFTPGLTDVAGEDNYVLTDVAGDEAMPGKSHEINFPQERGAL